MASRRFFVAGFVRRAAPALGGGLKKRPLLKTALGVCAGLGAGVAAWQLADYAPLQRLNAAWIPRAYAAATPKPQDNVWSQTKDHGLYLWIHLKPDADVRKCAKTAANVRKLVDEVSPPDLRDESDEVWAGVGFGPAAYEKLGMKAPESFIYPARNGSLGELPSTGGDIFVYAKSNSMSKLYELAEKLHQTLPAGCWDSFQDTYSFVYRNGRDLSGFIDGTENASDDEDRFKIATNKTSGGSFCITQKWLHQHDHIRAQKDKTLEGWVGRDRGDSSELKKKPATSHVARMTSGEAFDAPAPFEIVRQSMPYGTVGGDSGLFFIGFAESTQNFEYMLDRMTGTGEHGKKDGLCDDIMRLSVCKQGTYWYFPSQEELKRIAK